MRTLRSPAVGVRVTVGVRVNVFPTDENPEEPGSCGGGIIFMPAGGGLWLELSRK